jgi:hypothetical protein
MTGLSDVKAMTSDQAYELAKFQRVGVVLIVGAEYAYEKQIEPISRNELSKMKGDLSWSDRELRLRLGYLPSDWAKCFAGVAHELDHEVSDDEYHWLHGAASLKDARAWIDNIIQERGAAC